MRYLVVICLLFSNAFAEKKVVFFTIPRAGTHLLKKAVETLAQERVGWVFSKNLEETVLQSPNRYFITHITSDQVPDEELFTSVLLVRDPRDVMVSFLHHMMGHNRWFFGSQLKIKDVGSRTVDDLMAEVLQYPTYSPGDGVLYAAKWMGNPAVTVIRFEDLVGVEGGGSLEAQEAALGRLAECMGLELGVHPSLFGRSWGFRNGQIGEWEEIFSAENKQLCKKLYGQAIVELGYEKNTNW